MIPNRLFRRIKMTNVLINYYNIRNKYTYRLKQTVNYTQLTYVVLNIRII